MVERQKEEIVEELIYISVGTTHFLSAVIILCLISGSHT